MSADRIRSRPYVWQPVAWTDGRVLTRGSVDGLPALTWGRADRAELATARQLRELGLRPAGAEPVAVLVFGHRQPGRRPVEYTSLYRIADAAPKRTATPAQQAAIERALAARRTCQECGQEQDYYLSTVSRMCGPCSEATGYWDDPDDQADDLGDTDADTVADTDAEGWRAEHEAAMRAEDPHRPVTETDLADDRADPEPAELDGRRPVADPVATVDPVAEVNRVAIPVQRSAEPDPPAPAAATATAGGGGARAAQGGTATRDDETARAVARAQQALTRIAQRRTAAAPRAVERDRAGWLARWQADDQAADQDDEAAGELYRELEGSTR